MTSIDIPLDVLLERGPPEAVEECAPSRIEPLVTEVVVGIAYEWESLVRGNIKLMSPLVLPPPEPIIEQEETRRRSKKLSCSLVV